MSAGDIVLQTNQGMRWISQIMQQNFHSDIWKRFSDQPHESYVVFQILSRVVSDLLAVIFLEKFRVNFLLGRLELAAHVILLADENELARCGVIVVLEEVVDAEPKIFEIKLGHIIAIDGVGIKVIFFEIPAIAASLFFFAANEPCSWER